MGQLGSELTIMIINPNLNPNPNLRTCLLISYATHSFPGEYIPTVFDIYTVSITLEGEDIKLQVIQTRRFWLQNVLILILLLALGHCWTRGLWPTEAIVISSNRCLPLVLLRRVTSILWQHPGQVGSWVEAPLSWSTNHPGRNEEWSEGGVEGTSEERGCSQTGIQDQGHQVRRNISSHRSRSQLGLWRSHSCCPPCPFS